MKCEGFLLQGVRCLRGLCLGTGNCPEGIACPRAHSLEELRTLAAIQQTNLAANFKTERCSAYDTTQTCPRGAVLHQCTCEDYVGFQPVWYGNDVKPSIRHIV